VSGPRGAVRETPPRDPAAPTTRDLEQAIGEVRYVDLRVTANQTLASTGARIFKSNADPKTDLLALKAGIPNLVPHGLGRAVKHVHATLLGDARLWLGATPAGFDETTICALHVSSDVTARARVR
jgi:hypothetical protein